MRGNSELQTNRILRAVGPTTTVISHSWSRGMVTAPAVPVRDAVRRPGGVGVIRAEDALRAGAPRMEQSRGRGGIAGLAGPVRDVVPRRECLGVIGAEDALLVGEQRM